MVNESDQHVKMIYTLSKLIPVMHGHPYQLVGSGTSVATTHLQGCCRWSWSPHPVSCPPDRCPFSGVQVLGDAILPRQSSAATGIDCCGARGSRTRDKRRELCRREEQRGGDDLLRAAAAAEGVRGAAARRVRVRRHAGAGGHAVEGGGVDACGEDGVDADAAGREREGVVAQERVLRGLGDVEGGRAWPGDLARDGGDDDDAAGGLPEGFLGGLGTC